MPTVQIRWTLCGPMPHEEQRNVATTAIQQWRRRWLPWMGAARTGRCVQWRVQFDVCEQPHVTHAPHDQIDQIETEQAPDDHDDEPPFFMIYSQGDGSGTGTQSDSRPSGVTPGHNSFVTDSGSGYSAMGRPPSAGAWRDYVPGGDGGNSQRSRANEIPTNYKKPLTLRLSGSSCLTGGPPYKR